MCGKGKFNVSYRIPDKGKEGIEHLWEIHCSHCRGLYNIEKRGNLIGVVKKPDEMAWERDSKEMGKGKSRGLLHRPKFIRIILEIRKLWHRPKFIRIIHEIKE
jgi:hypothetical protein